MGFLEKIGLTRQTARPVGQQLESGRPAEGASPRRKGLVKGGIFLSLLLIALLAFPSGEVYEYTTQVGEAWRQPTLVAPFNFPVQKDPEALAAEQREVRRTTPPYFQEVPNAQQQVAASRDTVQQQIDAALAAYASALRDRRDGEQVEAAEDSLRYAELRRSSRLRQFSSRQWDALARDYAARAGLLADTVLADTVLADTAGARSPARRLDRTLLDQAQAFSEQLLATGALDVPLDSVRADEIIIRNEAERSDRLRAREKLYGLNEAYAAARDYFNRQYPDQPETAQLGYAFFQALFQPSLQYLRAETEQEWARKASRIAPTRGAVQEGEVVVRKGDRVDAETKRKITSLERAKAERSGGALMWRQILGELLLVFAVFLVFFLHLFFMRPDLFDDNRAVLLIALLFAAILGLFAIVIRVPSVGLYVVPVAIASVQLTIIFDSRVGLFGTLTLAVLGGLLLGMNLEYTFATFFAGVLGVFSVRDIKNRGQYFLSGGLVLAGYAFVLTASWLFLGTTTSDRLVSNLGLVAINSVFVVMAYPLLWVFERAFDVTTDLALLELSDMNRKLLKELSLRAAGSFNHSLQVANLAEAAADSIGADTLLTRVGALYHDIGKMLKPEYFVENQRAGENPHDRLKPRMSALIIASHVKEGLEMGRQHGLPQRVLDFIPMHHGTTRIEYFYRRAVEQNGPEDPEVLESEFRYPGPRPNSRETGILMLADSVEAASRSLEDPSHKRLDTLIDGIFRARSEDGQLDDSGLTFRDLSQMRQTFLSMLMGVYHVRVKYPDQDEDAEDEEGNEKGKSDTSAGKVRKAIADDAAAEKSVGERAAAGGPDEGPNAETPEEKDDSATIGPPEQDVAAENARLPSEADADHAASSDQAATGARARGDGATTDVRAEDEQQRRG